MTDVWRRKGYYAKRVLIDTERVLSPQFEDSLVCITGAQFEMLRNLTQYLKRRSTFASNYADTHYLCPTEEEWDTIQAIVADLEETLMGCTEITDALNAMAAQLACICNAMQGQLASTQPSDPGYTDQQYYDEYVSDVIPDEGDPPSGFSTWEEWHAYVCKGAQKVVDDAVTAVYDMGTKLTTGILITFSVINAALLLTVITAPVSMVLQIVTTLIAIGVNFAYEDVAAWLQEHKELLVCSIYSATDAGNAHSSVQAAIAEEWDAGSGVQIVQALFSRDTISRVFDGTMRNEDVWLGDYSEAYCEPCGDFPEGYTFLFTWPPCPSAYFTNGGVCWSGWLSFNGAVPNADQKVVVDLETTNRLDWTLKWTSALGSGFTVGSLQVVHWNTETLDWESFAAPTFTNNVAIGLLNVQTGGSACPSRDGGLFKLTLTGMPAQGETEPYPFMLQHVEVTFSQT